MVTEENTPEAVVALQRRTETTHRTIAALAASKVALDHVRTADDASPKQISDAARTYRAIEAQLKADIDSEVAAQIALMDYQISNGDVSIS